ncbi:hypothetical protein ES703_70222 [subsurface metagenome]
MEQLSDRYSIQPVLYHWPGCLCEKCLKKGGDEDYQKEEKEGVRHRKANRLPTNDQGQTSL